jgi:hypothetical protein
MTVTYTAIRSIEGLTQEDLRDPAISGSGPGTDVLISSGSTTAFAGAGAIWDTTANFTADGVVEGDTAINLNTSNTATVTNVLSANLLVVSPGIVTAAPMPYEIRRITPPPGQLLVDVIPDGKGFNYIFIEE